MNVLGPSSSYALAPASSSSSVLSAKTLDKEQKDKKEKKDKKDKKEKKDKKDKKDKKEKDKSKSRDSSKEKELSKSRSESKEKIGTIGHTTKKSKEFTMDDLKKDVVKDQDKRPATSKPLEYSTKTQLKSAVSSDGQHALTAKINNFEKLNERKQEAIRKQREYQQKLKEMKAKVNQRPLLVESATDASNKNKSKMKVLLQIKKSLEDSGLKIDTYFTEEELNLIQEADYLTTMNRLKP